jgi:hypothetical protein
MWAAESLAGVAQIGSVHISATTLSVCWSGQPSVLGRGTDAYL